jgi:sugar/nucleoside kinase (ribokinase family)
MKLACFDFDAFVRMARAHGSTVSIDTDWDPTGTRRERMLRACRDCDVVMTNLAEGADLTGESTPGRVAAALAVRSDQVVAVKMGPDGALLRRGDTELHSPAPKVEVTDTTCCGDAFAAGLVYGLGRQWPLDKCLSFACSCGALAATDLSTRGIHGLDQALSLMETLR